VQWSIQTDPNLFHYDRHDKHTDDASLTAEGMDMSKVSLFIGLTSFWCYTTTNKVHVYVHEYVHVLCAL
jgi:hypothetical protein